MESITLSLPPSFPPSRLLGTPAARWPPHETGGRAGVQRFHRGGKSRAANTEADLRLAHRCRDALSSTRARPANGFLAASGNDNELDSLFSQPESPVMATSPTESITSSIIFIVG